MAVAAVAARAHLCDFGCGDDSRLARDRERERERRQADGRCATKQVTAELGWLQFAFTTTTTGHLAGRIRQPSGEAFSHHHCRRRRLQACDRICIVPPIESEPALAAANKDEVGTGKSWEEDKDEEDSCEPKAEAKRVQQTY